MTRHLPHLLMLVIPMLAFAGLFALEWRRQSDEPFPRTLWIMAATSTGAGAIHGAVTAHHAREAPALGWAMAVMCLAQLTWTALVVFQPVRRVVELGVVGNLAIIVLWTWTRAVGIPFGIAGGLKQTVGPWDVSCTLLEVGCVLAGLAWIWSGTVVRQGAAVTPARAGLVRLP